MLIYSAPPISSHYLCTICLGIKKDKDFTLCVCSKVHMCNRNRKQRHYFINTLPMYYILACLTNGRKKLETSLLI